MRFETTGQFQAWAKDRQVAIAPAIRSTSTPARPRTRPAAPPAAVPPPALEELFQAIQILATRHRWANQYTYNADGPDAGLHVILARDVMLHAEVALTPDALTANQQAWLAAIRATGQGEAYVWWPEALPQIRERLSRKRGAP